MSDRQSSPNFWQKMKLGLMGIMRGRYGTDQLNTLILIIGVAFCVASMLMPSPLHLIFTLLAYGCMGVALFRMLSRNTYKRYLENRKYLSLLNRLRDRDHKYFDCPRCRQPVRVPKGKGKIAISCPKCKEKFIRKS